MKKKSHRLGGLWAEAQSEGNTEGPFTESPGCREMGVFLFTLQRRCGWAEASVRMREVCMGVSMGGHSQ